MADMFDRARNRARMRKRILFRTILYSTCTGVAGWLIADNWVNGLLVGGFGAVCTLWYYSPHLADAHMRAVKEGEIYGRVETDDARRSVQRSPQ